jgi:hypothetical protein
MKSNRPAGRRLNFYGHIRVLEYQVLKQIPHATVTQYQVLIKPTRLEILTQHLGYPHALMGAVPKRLEFA